MSRTKGELEAEIAKAVIKFQKEQQGRGPTDVRAFLVADQVLVRMSGIFTPNETHLAVTDEGRKLIRSARIELRSINHEEIEEILSEILGCSILRSYYDLSVERAEQIEVYILATNLENRLTHQRL